MVGLFLQHNNPGQSSTRFQAIARHWQLDCQQLTLRLSTDVSWSRKRRCCQILCHTAESCCFGSVHHIIVSHRFLQVARDIPYAAVQFTTFEALKRRRAKRVAQQQDMRQELSRSQAVLSNIWMGAVCSLLC